MDLPNKTPEEGSGEAGEYGCGFRRRMRIGPHQPLPHGPQSLPGQPYGEWTTLSLASGAPLLQRGERQVPGTGESGGYWTHPKLGKQVLHSVGLDQEQLEESTSPEKASHRETQRFPALNEGSDEGFLGKRKFPSLVTCKEARGSSGRAQGSQMSTLASRPQEGHRAWPWSPPPPGSDRSRDRPPSLCLLREPRPSQPASKIITVLKNKKT